MCHFRKEGACAKVYLFRVLKIVRVYIVDTKKNNNANELLFVCTKERKKEAAPIIKTRDRTLTKNTRFNKMSERKSARRAPTPKRFSDEDVEKKPARKSTTSTTPGGGGSKVRVFLPFRI